MDDALAIRYSNSQLYLITSQSAVKDLMLRIKFLFFMKKCLPFIKDRQSPIIAACRSINESTF
jgi:hypothetical protein